VVPLQLSPDFQVAIAFEPACVAETRIVATQFINRQALQGSSLVCISTQGSRCDRTLGSYPIARINPERVSLKANPFRLQVLFVLVPRVLAALEPGAEISERLRRIFKLNTNEHFKLLPVIYPDAKNYSQRFSVDASRS
jgi:hypothetical protein